ncbi:Putative virion core protein (lumpy skin disease virus) [hydrothermal vent metagenome]|uniref:Putative virion core protein (Lumpy skin disease virus) n=1 Tax=hydrothermal vent metagenome TaxID=652676 RepID=A0A1W1B9L2_9ZZZZ
MGLFDWVGGQFIDVIEWTDDSNDTMVYRFERQGNEIKYGAKLIVRESQVAVFVNEGEIADILSPGTYELETKNMPILTSLKHWDHGFNSPFKAEVYFINTKRFTDLKWGTKNPIMVRDPEFSMVRLRAFGTYEIRIQDPKLFLQEIVGTDGHFTTSEIDAQLTNLIVSKLPPVLGASDVPALDLAANYEKFGKFITEKISPYFDEYGIKLTKILIENISLPAEVEKALDRRTSREITGDLNANMQYQAAEALGKDGGGGMSEMAGLGAGMAMASQMANMMGGMSQSQPQPQSQPAPASPPPLPSSEEQYFVAIDKKAQGPYGPDELKAMIMNQSLKRETLVWREGMSEWEKASEHLAPLFSSVPPAL